MYHFFAYISDIFSVTMKKYNFQFKISWNEDIRCVAGGVDEGVLSSFDRDVGNNIENGW